MHNAVIQIVFAILYLIDVSSAYHNPRLDEQLSYPTTFVCQFGTYRYKLLPFRAVAVGAMFQRKIDKIIMELSIVVGSADDILVVAMMMMRRVLCICKK